MGEDTAVDGPYRNAMGERTWPATVTRPDVANAAALARQSHDPCKSHQGGVMKVLKSPNRKMGIRLPFKRENDKLSVYCDAGTTKKKRGTGIQSRGWP